MHSVIVVSGSRADWGLLEPVVNGLRDVVDVYLISMGRSPVKDVHWHISCVLEDDTPEAISSGYGIAVSTFAQVLEDVGPDMVMVLGDRWEVHAACVAAHIAGVPICHIHGGEITQGSYDQGFRDGITCMAKLHMTSSSPASTRVDLLSGWEEVHEVGCLGVEGLSPCPSSERQEHVIVSIQPETASNGVTKDFVITLLEWLDKRQIPTMFFPPNSDVFSSELDMKGLYPSENVTVCKYASRESYLSMLGTAKCIIGNSSSGIFEAPALHTPTINIGTRQKGRLMASSVISCAPEIASFEDAWKRVLSGPGYGDWTKGQRYWGENVAQKIVNFIREYLEGKGV